MTIDMQTALAAKALEIHKRLCALYGCPVPYFHHLDPLSELVSSLLSHRTRNHDSGVAFKALRARFPTWEEVRDAETAQIQATIAAVTWPGKSPAPATNPARDHAAAWRIVVGVLADLPVAEARAWLQGLPGAGPKTSAATLLFSLLRMPALPVDSHHYRVAQRTGLIGPKIGEAQAHKILEAQLPQDWPAQDVYDNHEIMMFTASAAAFSQSLFASAAPCMISAPRAGSGNSHLVFVTRAKSQIGLCQPNRVLL